MDRRDKAVPVVPHQLILQDRNRLEFSGITEVVSFDDTSVHCVTSLGRLSIVGSDFHLHRLDLEGTALSVEGRIDSLNYTDLRKGGLLGRLLR